MKIATYNIWNHSTAFDDRLNAMCEELIRVNADLVALQEVPMMISEPKDQLFVEHLARRTGYAHYHFNPYLGDDEGLAILSRGSLEEAEYTGSRKDMISNCAMRVTTDMNGVKIGVTNVHLNWKSVLTREKEIVGVSEWIEQDSSHTDAEFLCGDFNSFPYTSSIYNFLMGHQSLADKDTSWIDLPELFAHAQGQEPQATLDFKKNPWLHNRDKLNDYRKPYRFDWILLKSLYPKEEPSLINTELFGLGRGKHQLPPSDHYGVIVEVSVENLYN